MVARLIFLLLLTCLVAEAQVYLPHRRLAFRKVASGGAAPSYLFQENFEGAGYENSWTEAGAGTIDEDNTAVVIAGSESLDINCSSAAGSAFISFTAADTIFVAFKWRHASGNAVIASIRTSGASARATLNVASGVMRVQASGGTANDSTDALPADTTTDIWCWFEYVKGTGANAIARAGWSTDGSKPTFTASAGKSCVSSDGTGTDQVSRLYIGSTASQTFRHIYDTVRGDDETIPASFP